MIPQLQRVIISALLQFCVPSSRYGRRDSLQVGTPHSIANLVSSWVSSVWVVERVSAKAACVDLLNNVSPQMSYWAHVGYVAL